MSKWTNTSAGKIQCNRFNKAWGALNWERNTSVELGGTVGGNEYRTAITKMIGTDDGRADVAEAKQRIGERFGWTVTAQNVNDIIKAIEAELVTLKANRPVIDNRKTPEQVAEQNANLAKIHEEQKEKENTSARAFVAHYGSGEKVTVQPGQMAVVAKICYDNSDSMSDYYDRHASLSQSFALLVVPKQAETERLARRGVAVSPLLSSIEFDWHTEKWSMGHGNYLESKGGFELPAELQNLRNRYGSGDGVKRAHWEITFQQAYRDAFTLDTIAGYGTQPTQPSGPGPVSVSGVEVTENEEKDGIEIRFPSKPAADVLDSLKANGWRWSRFSSCWYTRRTERARQFAESLKSGKAEAVNELNDYAGAGLDERYEDSCRERCGL